MTGVSLVADWRPVTNHELVARRRREVDCNLAISVAQALRHDP